MCEVLFFFSSTGMDKTGYLISEKFSICHHFWNSSSWCGLLCKPSATARFMLTTSYSLVQFISDDLISSKYPSNWADIRFRWCRSTTRSFGLLNSLYPHYTPLDVTQSWYLLRRHSNKRPRTKTKWNLKFKFFPFHIFQNALF